jgi:hypothetical protein
MSWGLYSGQMHWFLTQFAREQMLLLSVHTDSSDADPNVYLQTVLDFLGIPAVARLPEVDGFSHSNHADASQAEDILDCDLHALLTESSCRITISFMRWNRSLSRSRRRVMCRAKALVLY